MFFENARLVVSCDSFGHVQSGMPAGLLVPGSASPRGKLFLLAVGFSLFDAGTALVISHVFGQRLDGLVGNSLGIWEIVFHGLLEFVHHVKERQAFLLQLLEWFEPLIPSPSVVVYQHEGGAAWRKSPAIGVVKKIGFSVAVGHTVALDWWIDGLMDGLHKRKTGGNVSKNNTHPHAHTKCCLQN